MNFTETIKVAWKSLYSNKSRSVLTMLGVIIGVAAVIVMIAISSGTEATISEAIHGLGSNLIFITGSMTRGGPGQPVSGGLVYDDVAAIREGVSGINGVSVEQSTSQTIKFGSVSLESIPVIGTTPDYTAVRDLQIAEGRFFTETDLDRTQKVAVLGATIAEELFGEDELPVGQKITVGDTKLTVVGVLADKGYVSGTNYDEQIYVPISVVFQKFMPSMFARVMGDQVRMIFVSVADDANMENVILQIELLLAQRHEVTLVHHGQDHIFHRVDLGEQVVRLKNETQLPVADRGQRFFGKVADIFIVEVITPFRWAVQTAQNIHQSAFPGAGRSHDGHKLAFFDVEAHAVQRGYLNITHTVNFLDVFCFNNDPVAHQFISTFPMATTSP